jgi:hypothetical protein
VHYCAQSVGMVRLTSDRARICILCAWAGQIKLRLVKDGEDAIRMAYSQCSCTELLLHPPCTHYRAVIDYARCFVLHQVQHRPQQLSSTAANCRDHVCCNDHDIRTW